MTLFSRYIATINIRLLLLCYGAFTSIYLVIDILERVGKLTRSGGSPEQIMRYFLWKIPEISTLIIPFSVLMATMLTLGALSRSSELTAMRCSGAGLFRITAPMLGLAFSVSLINLALSEIVLPVSYDKMRYIEEIEIKKRNPNTFFRKGAIWHRDENAILNASLLDPETSALKGVTLWEGRGNLEPVSRIEAAEAVRKGNAWLMLRAVQYRYSSGKITSTTRSAELESDIRLTLTDLQTVGKQAENMGFMELLNYCEALEKGGYDPTRYKTLLHSKLANPLSPLVMALLAIPFSLRGGRSSGPALGIGISLIIGIAYFIASAFMISFGKGGVLPPMVAAWASNIIFCATAVWLTLTVNR